MSFALKGMIYSYLRVSTREQANGFSLETQNNQCCGYAMMKGWPAPYTFQEPGVSGSVPFQEREQGNNLLAAVRSGDCIVAAKLDRMFRSAVDAMNMLEKFKANGIQLHLIDLGGDVTGNGISKLVFTILAAVAENERDRIRERIREVKDGQKQKGHYLGGNLPYGYTIIDGKLVPDEVEQSNLKQMKGLRDEGFSYQRIADRLGTGMTRTTVKRILKRL